MQQIAEDKYMHLNYSSFTILFFLELMKFNNIFNDKKNVFIIFMSI